MSKAARVAKACSSRACGWMLVRGDRVSFVSVEREKQTGAHELDEKRMPSDIVIPAGYVLVGDTTGAVFDRCNFYVVKWHDGGQRVGTAKGNEALQHAQEYFGDGATLRSGAVDIPKGPWQRVAKVKYIRYRRVGEHAGSYEHTYEIPVDLQYCKSPLAWRIPLPQGCVVDERGFVWP